MTERYPSEEALHQAMLRRAALAALRSQGLVEPNPCVGAVVARAQRLAGGAYAATLAAVARHRRLGGPHAEVEAIERCAARGEPTEGAWLWVTLEPCAHHGRTPPCVEAILRAGFARVIIASRDPGVGAGGLEQLRQAGVPCLVYEREPLSCAVSAPYRKRLATGLPWVIAKWAQTIDGALADRAGASRWISSHTSRRLVHRLRGRVDAVIVGADTACRDDPQLTARLDRLPRRRALRVVLDPSLRTPVDSALGRSTHKAPVALLCAPQSADTPQARLWRNAGAVVEPLLDASDRGAGLQQTLRWLAQEHDATNVLVEGGGATLGAFFAHDLVDEAMAFVAPRALGDSHARRIGAPLSRRLSEASSLSLVRVRGRAGDALLHWRTLRW
ncbi:MAG: bifunctional diaminohydroxyphosphoribosylaminopyrimidine deaminase/5-amino-6-(5-phosphoribosylamino)uracil reductase RibD [Planctomycetota bacterium]|nr:MAG: bifunctional diaminohydroxyphosphoribosylaminopyrimidine deaminase/5-amino-6-(5-phosphoribosylamino)uracil reductase RibD [Planctomycetota bacterium]